MLFALGLTSFTAYTLLDTFVLEKTIEIDQESTQEVIVVENDYSDAQGVFTENSYQDQYMSVVITTHREYDTQIYVADIYLKSPDLLKTALANDTYGKNVVEVTSSIAKRKNAIVAINGDYYGAQETGYVVRNGVLYRNSKRAGINQDLAIYSDGTFEVFDEDDISAEELMENGALQILSFGPGLVQNGEIIADENTEVAKHMASNPRSAIGQVGDLHYVIVCSDGRTPQSAGLSLFQLAEFMQRIGCSVAYNLDGGGSSSMVFNNTQVNIPTTNGVDIKERGVSDIVYIGY